jgi:hypothetical protein
MSGTLWYMKCKRALSAPDVDEWREASKAEQVSLVLHDAYNIVERQISQIIPLRGVLSKKIDCNGFKRKVCFFVQSCHHLSGQDFPKAFVTDSMQQITQISSLYSSSMKYGYNTNGLCKRILA